jgi:hypothetical protein
MSTTPTIAPIRERMAFIYGVAAKALPEVVKKRLGRPRGKKQALAPDLAEVSPGVNFKPGSKMAKACWEGRCGECHETGCACMHHLIKVRPLPEYKCKKCGRR